MSLQVFLVAMLLYNKYIESQYGFSWGGGHRDCWKPILTNHDPTSSLCDF